MIEILKELNLPIPGGSMGPGQPPMGADPMGGDPSGGALLAAASGMPLPSGPMGPSVPTSGHEGMLLPPMPEPGTDWKDILRGVASGMASGYTGQPNTYAQTAPHRMERLSNQRKRAMAEDGLVGRNLMQSAIEASAKTGKPVDPKEFTSFMEHRIEEINRLGGDPSDTQAELYKARQDPYGWVSSMDQDLLTAEANKYIELPRNFADRAQKDTTMMANARALTAGNPGDPGYNESYRKNLGQLLKIGAPGREPIDVQSSQILPDGTVVMVTETGQRMVRNSDGDLITGKRATKAIKEAYRYGAEIQGTRAGERSSASQSTKMAGEMYMSAQAFNKTIDLYDDALTALTSGANVGPIMSRIPSVEDQSIMLENIQKNLGLSMIQTMTLGSLSDPEREAITASVLPANLSETGLREWITHRKMGLRKIMKAQQEAAFFLSDPENNVNDYMRIKGIGTGVEPGGANSEVDWTGFTSQEDQPKAGWDEM